MTATGGKYGAGIGGGIESEGGSVTITGGTVTANGGSSVVQGYGPAMGIGRGSCKADDQKANGALTLGDGIFMLGDDTAPAQTLIASGPQDDVENRTQFMRAQPHSHSFTYTASGATITATCIGQGNCDLSDGLQLTLSAPKSLTCDGKAKAATLSTGYNTTAFPGTLKVTCKKDDKTVSAAKDAGKYTASVTVGSATASVTFTIAKASQKAPSAPVVTATTGTSITVKAVSGQQYKISSGNWQTTGTFKGLTPGKQYTIYTRKAADVNHKASPASTGAKARTTSAAILMQTGAKVAAKGKTSYTVIKGKSVTLSATVTPKKGQLGNSHGATLRYATSDSAVATVDKNGKVTAKGVGVCTIQLIARNGLSKNVTVTVKQGTVPNRPAGRTPVRFPSKNAGRV